MTKFSNKNNLYGNLAKQAVETYIKEGETCPLPQGLPKETLERKAGVFVTIESKTNGKKQLRGCIGTYLPTKENIAQEIIDNAIAAASQDYRFSPLKEEELPCLTYTVSILSKPEQITDVKRLNPKKYGILIKTKGFPRKSALLLPDLEGIDTIEQQISIACQKGGIDPTRDKIMIYRFNVEKYE